MIFRMIEARLTERLAPDVSDFCRPNTFYSFVSGLHQWSQVLDISRECDQNNHCQVKSRQILLIFQIAISGEKDIELRFLPVAGVRRFRCLPIPSRAQFLLGQRERHV
jgi:hypothetical protein